MEKKKINFSKDPVLTAIYPYILNKAVLDIGCVEHTLTRKNKSRIWVHDFLKENAETVTGIDISKEDIVLLKKQGYDVYLQNAEEFKLNKKFDVIFAGELIEHLSNPGLFLDKCKKHLKSNGVLIITTPNAFSMTRILQIILRHTNDPPVNSQHTSWYSPKVITELLLRYNFKIQTVKFVDFPRIKEDSISRIIKILCTLLGSKFRETMIVISKV